MSIDVRLDDARLRQIIREAPGRVESWLDGVSEQIVTEIKLSFGTSPPGRSYQRGSVVHVASQPGYPPNVDTGTLRASMRWKRTGRFERRILDGVDYGYGLEIGHDGVLPRPFVSPVFVAWRRKIAQDARDNLRIDE